MYPGMLDRETRTGKDDEVKMAAQLGELPVRAQEKYKEQMGDKNISNFIRFKIMNVIYATQSFFPILSSYYKMLVLLHDYISYLRKENIHRKKNCGCLKACCL